MVSAVPTSDLNPAGRAGECQCVRAAGDRSSRDADVRAFTVETVRELGYDVLEARDGNSALNVLKQTPADKIDLPFSDVVLPGGINGQQLITKPFAFEALAARLRSVLDGQDSSRHVN